MVANDTRVLEGFPLLPFTIDLRFKNSLSMLKTIMHLVNRHGIRPMEIIPLAVILC